MVDMLEISQHGRSYKVFPGRNGDFWESVSRGEWEAETFAIFDQFIDGQHAYIDIGSWIGPTLLYGCQLAKRAYAIEPDPVAWAELQKNIAFNRPLTDNVTLFHVCIAPKSGLIAFGNRRDGGDSMSSVLFSRGKTSWMVEGVRFEEFIKQNEINGVNFIKMDIEGGEYSVLPTMTAYLKEHRPTIHLSLHPRFLGVAQRSGFLGRIERAAARFKGTLSVIRSLNFYKHFYDCHANRLASARLLWVSLRGIVFDIVATDVEWHGAENR